MPDSPSDFEIAVQKSFGQLAHELGMAVTSSNRREVSFANESVTLSVGYDADFSFEVDVRISRKGYGDMDYLLLSNLVPDGLCSGGGWMAQSPGALASLMHSVAELAREYAYDLLRGDEVSFRREIDKANNRNEAHAVERKLRHARAHADLAWANKDYTGVITALQPFATHLSPAELKRLEYSKRAASGVT